MITKEAILNRTPRNPSDSNFIHESYVEQAMDEWAREIVTAFSEWFMPDWRFKDLGEWENATTGQVLITDQLFNLYLKETQGV